ncbi:MAG: hypothetical protein QXW56_10515 [Nitrososphaerota archaeon]
MSLPSKEFFEIIMTKVRNIPFSYVIEMTTGHKVLPITEDDKETIEEIYAKAKEVLEAAKDEDFGDLRPNEISIRLEDTLRSKLRGSIPENKAAGYPNIIIERKGKYYYIEVKLAEVEQLNSNFRTFYYEPVELAKVTKDASHILVGFIHQKKAVVGFKIVDLSKINVNLKSEFNTNNKELYKASAVIKSYSESATSDTT